jgi:uncharacterized protein YuzE
LKFTRYFETIRLRADRAMIRVEWIQHVVQHPVREVIQSDGRIHRWATVRSRHENQVLSGHRYPYIEFRTGTVLETKDLDENTQVDLDGAGNICAMTVEHAKERADLPHFSFEHVGT